MSVYNRDHTKIPFPKIRGATIGVLNAAKRKNMIHSFVEIDISETRKSLRRLKRRGNSYLSLTGYIIFCVSKLVAENNIMHAYRNRRGQLVLFSDVDVSTTIERKLKGNREVVAMIIRGANHKSVEDISLEIKEEKEREVTKAEVYRSIGIFLRIPAFIRQIFFRMLDRSPLMMKRRAGTIMVTSANMIGKGAGWGLPIATHTLNITIGGIVDRIVQDGNHFIKREHLCLTLSFDHDIIDGAPAARFIRDLKRHIESGDLSFPVKENEFQSVR
jgi:pyruvate/2-oxoglutarate dehydrogenase complex dihydrolipoamide acyltransferase (E2) component